MAAQQVKPADRPCAYHPWQTALFEVMRTPPFIGLSLDGVTPNPQRLIEFAEDLSKPGWPEPRRDLIEFAFVFLEADVMLFRSGYTKRHLIKRLQQAPLTEIDVDRVHLLLKRAVLEGTGHEEARAFRKLAASLVVQGKLPDLENWLDQKAKGAGLTMQHLPVSEYFKFLTNPDRSDIELGRFVAFHRWGFRYPDMDTLVKVGKQLTEPDQKARRTAYYMLHAIRTRQSNQV